MKKVSKVNKCLELLRKMDGEEIYTLFSLIPDIPLISMLGAAVHVFHARAISHIENCPHHDNDDFSHQKKGSMQQ